MSSSAKGAQRVGSAMTQLAKLGFRCSRVSASGQRKGARKAEKCIAGDLIALAPDGSLYPHVIAEIGGVSKRVRTAFAELRAEPLAAGFVPIVGRVVKRRWLWYSSPGSRHKTLKEALEATVPLVVISGMQMLSSRRDDGEVPADAVRAQPSEYGDDLNDEIPF